MLFIKPLCFVIFICLFISPISHAQEAYILGAGDKISIKVFGQEDLSIESFLGNSGSVNYPFLGNVKVVGLSIKQVELSITKGLKGDYLINPNVYVQVIEYRPFYIHGEVKKPGGYPYQPGMTINQAVALAGGLTDRADTDKIALYREADKNLKQHASLQHTVNAGDTITIEQRFF